ncbi:hypothetical protein PTM75_14890, partial [Clostridium perfringens]|nr:hypothetical protein [Clostridium perfringens]
FAVEETDSLEAALPKADVLYMTRIQKERFADPAEYDRLKDAYVLDRALVERLRGRGFAVEETDSLEAALPKADVLYMTRIQKERFADPAEYDRLKDA